jgi:hypothetical protein
MNSHYYVSPFAGSIDQARRTWIVKGIRIAFSLFVFCVCSGIAGAVPSEYFVIQVVDEQTGRGVPLVELRTTNDTAYYTDSNGVVAFLEPGLMNHKVFFTITSPGYEFPADGFGFHGTALQTAPGEKVTLKIKRNNIAERLYRLTGAGIYRDSVLARLPVPRRAPLLNGDVVGQDSVLAVPYRGALHWFWGDTSRADYPLGNFGTSGAVSSLTTDPDRGVDFTYFTDLKGFSRPMLLCKDPGPIWVSGVSTIENGSRLIAYYSRMENLGKALERGLAVYNDGTNTVDRVAQFDAARPLPLEGHPFLATDTGMNVLARTRGSARSVPPKLGAGGRASPPKLGAVGPTTYLIGTCEGASPLPCVRVPASLPALKDLSKYEYYTCLKPAASTADAQPERDAAGKLVYGWKRGAPCLTLERQQRLISIGAMQPDEALCQLRDVETGKMVRPHTGSVYWNVYRQRWIMILGQFGGDVSNIGEIWFAEADTAVGPWVYARKVATHPKMDFYNPTQQPFFDKDNGRRIYFEGTYVNTFSGNPIATPRYNYNQILYRLTLDDPRLALPMPVYRLASGDYCLREDLKLPTDSANIRAIPFYAIPPGRTHTGLIPIYGDGSDFSSARFRPGAKPLFYALAPGKPGGPITMPLTDRTGKMLGTVWRNPQSVLTLDFALKPTAVANATGVAATP